MNLNSPAGKKNPPTNKYSEELHGYHYVYDKGERNKISNAAKTNSKSKS